MGLVTTALLLFSIAGTAVIASSVDDKLPDKTTAHDKARALRTRIRVARTTEQLIRLEQEARRLISTTPNFKGWDRCLTDEINNKRSQLNRQQ